MTDPFLSIVITTFNRSFFLKQCLMSIETAVSSLTRGQKVEVIILNNGSTDDTGDILAIFEEKMHFKVFHTKDNILFVGGLLKCMSYASGKYCWILGDDDYIRGNFEQVVDYLKETDADITLLNHFFYMYENGNEKFLMKDRKSFLLNRPQRIYFTYTDYIKNAIHPNAFFTHIAPVIFKRDMWNRFFSPEVCERHKDSLSIHTFILLSILKQARIIGYFAPQLVALRVGDSPAEWMTEEGRYKRIRMDAEYFVDMVRDVFPEDIVVRRFKDVMLRKSISVLLIGTKLRCRTSLRFYSRVFRLLYANYASYPFFWYGIIPMLLIPGTAFQFVYRQFVSRS